jgi:GDP-4-dehydro-6-deoxy-D-mannose reductase
MSLDRILVTGADGFVGRHLLAALAVAFPLASIIGTSRFAGQGELLEITDAEQTREVFARLQPDICIHLAAIAAIGEARSNPRQAWEVNLHGTLNVANAILAQAPQCRMIFISSAECYGASFKSGLPLDEDTALAPMNLYAATKAATELALGVLAGDVAASALQSYGSRPGGGVCRSRLRWADRADRGRADAAGNCGRGADPGTGFSGRAGYLHCLYRLHAEIRQPAE